MKRKSIILVACLTLALPACPQSKPRTSGASSSFEEFRKGMLDDYNKFRKSILDDYDKFLEEAWGNYEKFKGEERYSEPKPSTPPTVTPDELARPVAD